MATVELACRADGRDALLFVRVQPAARHEGPGELRTLPPVRGDESRTVVVWHVRARAIDGRANAALVRAVADRVGRPRGAVEIIRGARVRDKVLRIRDCPVSVVVAALGGQSSR